VPFLLLPSSRAIVPTDYVLGRESAAAYLARAVPSAHVLQASSELIPPDTPVAYIGGVWEGPQLYSEARLFYVVPSLLGDTPYAIVSNLDLLDLRYLIWNRRDATDDDWRAPALSSPFLEEHARILAGGDDAYIDSIRRQDLPTVATKALREMRAMNLITEGDYKDGLRTLEGFGLPAAESYFRDHRAFRKGTESTPTAPKP